MAARTAEHRTRLELGVTGETPAIPIPCEPCRLGDHDRCLGIGRCGCIAHDDN